VRCFAVHVSAGRVAEVRVEVGEHSLYDGGINRDKLRS
jgi:hypothetical protein